MSAALSRADHLQVDRSWADRDMADRDVADRDVADRDVADRDVADRDVADRDVADRDAAGDRRTRLAAMRAAGLIRHASERTDTGVERSLPVGPALRPLFPGGTLRRGGTVAVATSQPPGAGSTSLLFALLAEASAAGSWCAVVGLPRLGMVAAAEAGVAVERLALVPHPGPEWAAVVGALIDGMDIVVVATPAGIPAQLASRLTARARQRGAVLVPIGQWPGADLTLEVVHGSWHGPDHGRGRLRGRQVEVLASGRGAAARARWARLWLPGPGGAAAPLAPTVVPLASSMELADLGQRRAS